MTDDVWRLEWQQRQVDRADEFLARQEAWERRLLSEDAARERRLMDDEERRGESVFDRDPLLEAEPRDD